MAGKPCSAAQASWASSNYCARPVLRCAGSTPPSQLYKEPSSAGYPSLKPTGWLSASAIRISAPAGSRSCSRARLRRWSNSGMACSACQSSAMLPGHGPARLTGRGAHPHGAALAHCQPVGPCERKSTACEQHQHDPGKLRQAGRARLRAGTIEPQPAPRHGHQCAPRGRRFPGHQASGRLAPRRHRAWLYRRGGALRGKCGGQFVEGEEEAGGVRRQTAPCWQRSGREQHGQPDARTMAYARSGD